MDNDKKLKRSKALVKAQRKYYQKIKEENTEVFQRLMKRQLDYLKNYRKKVKVDNPSKYNQIKEKDRIHSNKYYHENKDKILEQRRVIRHNKKDEAFERFLHENIIEEMLEKDL
jgi:hypothetical protein